MMLCVTSLQEQAWVTWEARKSNEPEWISLVPVYMRVDSLRDYRRRRTTSESSLETVPRLPGSQNSSHSVNGCHLHLEKPKCLSLPHDATSCRMLENLPYLEDLASFWVPTRKFSDIHSSLDKWSKKSLDYSNTSSHHTINLSIWKSIQIKYVAAVQNIAAGPLCWCNRPKLWYKMYTSLNITYRNYTTYPAPFSILLWAYFEHAKIGFWFGQFGVPLHICLEKDRGFQNPQGIGEGYRGVGVRVHILLPPTNPYPWWGYQG